MNERLKHQCHVDGCDSQAEWGVRVDIMCRAPGVDHLVRTKSSIEVCHRHKQEDKVRAFVFSPINRESITASLLDSGFPEPDFLSTTIIFEAIGTGHGVIAAVPTYVPCDRAGCAKAAKWQVVLRAGNLIATDHIAFVAGRPHDADD